MQTFHPTKFITALCQLCCLFFATHIHAQPKFIGQDLSGIYSCKGNNASVGDYDVIVTLKLNKINSRHQYGAYDLVTETENHVHYQGQAIATGNKLAITFKLPDAKESNYSTGIAQLKKISSQRWQFANHYYEPNDIGGNHGQEICTMKTGLNSKKTLINTP